MSRVVVKQGSAYRVFTDYLTANDLPADITGNDGVLFVLVDEEGNEVLSQAGTVLGVSPAHVQWTSGVGDFGTPTQYGQFWRVHYPSGAEEIYPDLGRNTIIVDPLAPARATTGATCTPWATLADLCSPCDDYNLDPVLLEDSIQMATDVLYNLTGRRWPGTCTDVIRPQAQYRSSPVPMWWPAIMGTRWGGSSWGWCSCHRPRDTGCASVPEIKLPGYPASADGLLVTIDAEEFTEWRLDDQRYLVRLDGQGWPCCQDMTADPTTDERTFQISYSYGTLPPLGGVHAAATLGCQYALASQPEAVSDGRCRLPKRITTITRAGTTIGMLDPLNFVEKGLTGIIEVDQWVTSINMGDARRRATVMVPGSHRSARRS